MALSIPTLEGDEEITRMEVAEKLGWREIGYNNDGYLVGHPPGRRDFHAVPSYARDIKAAWEVVDYLSYNGISLTIGTRFDTRRGRHFLARIEQRGEVLAQTEAIHAPLAICHVFLQIPGQRLVCSCNPRSQDRHPVSVS